MIRLIITDKPEINWFRQLFFLKKNLQLTLPECIKLFYYLKKDRDILIQSCKNETVINKKLEVQFFVLKDCFHTELKDIPYGPTAIVDSRHYINFLTDYKRGIRIFISKL